MKVKYLLLSSLLALAGASWAQNAPISGVSESTDPAKISAIEKRASELAAQAQKTPAPQPAARLHKMKKHKKAHTDAPPADATKG